MARQQRLDYSHMVGGPGCASAQARVRAYGFEHGERSALLAGELWFCSSAPCWPLRRHALVALPDLLQTHSAPPQPAWPAQRPRRHLGLSSPQASASGRALLPTWQGLAAQRARTLGYRKSVTAGWRAWA
jgi:hypothetical protein